MKYSVTSYSFSQYKKAGKLDPLSMIDKAKELGFDGIEFTDRDVDGIEGAKALRAHAAELDFPIVNLAAHGDILAPDGVNELLKQVDLAAALGVTQMRHDVASGKDLASFEGYENVLPRLVEGCRTVTEYARSLGIRTMTENHGRFSQDSLRVEKLINSVASDNFGWLVDVGNFLCADDDPAVAVGRAAKYAFHVHCKDFLVKKGDVVNPGRGFILSRGGAYLRGTIIGHGAVPVLQCLRALTFAGYDGWITVEFEGMEDCIEGCAVGLENLRRYVSLC